MGLISKAYLVGIHSRSEELIKKMRMCMEGKLSEEDVNKHLMKEVTELIELQASVGLSEVTDGQLKWHDLLRPFAENLEGVKVGGLARWFDNNVFYKRPVIYSRVSWSSPFLERYVCDGCLRGRNARLAIPDPYTFSALSENLHYRSFDELVLDVSEAFAAELAYLNRLGWLKTLQLSSPSVVFERLKGDHAQLFIDSVETIRRRISGELMIHTYFGDFSNALPHLLDAKVDVIGFDLTCTNLKGLSEYDIDKEVCVGIVDARSSYVDSVDELLSLLDKVLKRVHARRFHISPTADLEFLPKRVADEKVKTLGALFERARDEWG